MTQKRGETDKNIDLNSLINKLDLNRHSYDKAPSNCRIIKHKRPFIKTDHMLSSKASLTNHSMTTKYIPKV